MKHLSKFLALVPATALVVGIAAAGPATADRSAPESRPGHSQPRLTPAQVDKIQDQLATPDGKETVFNGLADSFGAVLVDEPTDTSRRETGPQDLSFGFDRDHAWIIASYSDIARGVIAVGVAACKRYIPALPFLCDYIGRLLKDWARGYAPLSNHGVWAELYLTGRVRAGRY